VLITLVSDVMPKGLAILLGRGMAIRLAPVVHAAELILAPVRVVLGAVVEPLTRLLTGAHRPSEYVTVEELRELLAMSERRRIINPDENAMLDEVVQLGRLRVRDVMVPRADIVAFEVHDDPDELRRRFRQQHLAKLPVYEDEIDRIIGLVYAKDFFLEPHRPIRELVRPVRFVPEIITLTQLLAHFRHTRTQLAIAVDEHGGVVGLVTVEDAAEQIVGDLAPAERPEEPSWERLDERRYRVSGGISIREWAEEFHVRPLDERVTTLAGLVLARLGRPAVAGDQVRLGNLLLTVEALHGRRIEWVVLELLDGQGGATPPGGRPV